MPIYEYRCAKCGERFEEFVRPSRDTIEVRCPRCKSEQVRKAFSVFGTRSASTMATTSGANCAPTG